MLAALGLALAGCERESETAELPPRPIVWHKVEPLQRAAQRTLSGIVQSTQRAPIAFEVSGRIDRIPVEIGDQFEQGDVLAALDARTFELTLQERRSALAEAQAVLEEAQNDYDRQKNLFERGWVSKSAFDAAKSALDTARSRVETARARVDLARENLNDTVLNAPYAGSVAQRLAEPAQQVSAGRTILEIQGDERGFEIAVSVPETLISRIRVGSGHQLSFPAEGLKARGIITEIGTNAESGGSYPVTLSVSEPPQSLRAGMSAEVHFQVGRPGGASADTRVAIPLTAFRPGENGTEIAFVYDPASQTVGRRLVTVSELDTEHAIVTDGLRPGEIIAARGIRYLRDGQPVALLGEGPRRYNP